MTARCKTLVAAASHTAATLYAFEQGLPDGAWRFLPDVETVRRYPRHDGPVVVLDGAPADVVAELRAAWLV